MNKVAIQSIDRLTNKTGSFLYIDNMEAITPVFIDLKELFDYCKENQINHEYNSSNYSRPFYKYDKRI
jgi:hypothetical protein